MFGWVKRRIQFAKVKNSGHETIPIQKISTNLSENITCIKSILQDSSDVIFRTLYIGKNQEVEAFLVAIDGLYDKKAIQDNIIKPLLSADFKNVDHSSRLENIDKELLSLSSIKKERTMEKSVSLLLKGDPLLFIDGMDCVYVLGARTWEMRNIEEPITETVVRGPREGFVETLRTNTSMIRRKLHNPNLRIKECTLGEISKTEIAIIYIDGLVSASVLQEVKKRLQKINIDAVLESGYIEEFIEDAPFSPFPTVANTERPDIVAARLLEGKVAIMVEGSATALIVPYLLLESFHSPEDYYSRPYYVSFVRIMRLFGFLTTTLAPASFVAFQDYHKEVLPNELLISLAGSREDVPFPLFLEVFIMLIFFELLREAGLRMPRPVGQTISIVGALVLGEAAVNAGFVGAPTVIVVALTAITSFLVTPLYDVAALLRMIYLIAAEILGIYGISLVITLFLLHVASLRSFGMPYMAPWFPSIKGGWKDFLLRAPIRQLKESPQAFRKLKAIFEENDSHKPNDRGEE